jgi:hypothetical protein
VKLDVQGAGTIRGFLTTTDAIKLGANTSAPTTTDAFIYRPADNTLAFGTSSTEQVRITSAGLLQFNSGYGSVATAYGCRAWINFDGTSGSIGTGRGSGNVSSVTDNGTGDYTVNFTTSMPDANYAAVATAKVEDNDSIGSNNNTTIAGTAVRAVGSVKVLTSSTSSVKVDCAIVNVAIFR